MNLFIGICLIIVILSSVSVQLNREESFSSQKEYNNVLLHFDEIFLLNNSIKDVSDIMEKNI